MFREKQTLRDKTDVKILNTNSHREKNTKKIDYSGQVIQE